MYARSTARVKVNGMLSETFDLKRGTKQGDPLSAQIFAICIEPLAEKIRNNLKIKGVSVQEDEHKLALYADDIIVYITDIKQTLPALLEEINKYGEISGYKLNHNKTEAMEIGENLENDFKKQFKLKWTRDKVRYLGIKIPNNLENLYQYNYGELLNTIRQDLTRWKIVPLTLFEKVRIIKMNILPRYIFLFQNLPIHIKEKSFKLWESQLRNFLWDGNKPRVKMKVLQDNKEKGGLSLPNLKNYFFATHVRTMLVWFNEQKNPKWKQIELKLWHCRHL
uniref:Reverse transcriptase domain-containing protein n=1 Tax=Neogobius melanostomus TaxID=47308 RepID=A0A8C6WLV1_9GOBI